MAKFEFISKRGDRLSLINNEYFDLIDLDGQTASAVTISSVVVGGVDGNTVTNVQANPRTITLNLYIKSGKDVEEAKRKILQVVKLKQYGAIVWEQNNRVVTISGIVESVEMPRWQKGILMQISLYCEQPFWEDVEDVIQEINEFIDLNYFTDDPADMLYFPTDGIPFGSFDTSRTKTFHNAGDVAVGIEIVINALDTVKNPIIYDTDGNFFGLGYGTGDKEVILQAGDVVKITTHKGNKTVQKNGVSLFDKVKPHSKWLQLETGDNQFKIDSDDDVIDNMSFNLIYKQRYI